MKTRCILSKSAMFLISFECERLAQMPAVTRKIHSPVKLVRRLMNRRWSSASISIVLAVCSRKAWETKKGHERERVTESPGYFRGEKKGEGKKQREGEDTPSESRNSIDPVRLTTPALRWSTDGRLMKGRSKTDASSISLHWRCNVFACGHVRIVYFREHSSIYRSIDRSIVVSAWRKIDSTSLNILFPWPQEKLFSRITNYENDEFFFSDFPCWSMFYEFTVDRVRYNLPLFFSGNNS